MSTYIVTDEIPVLNGIATQNPKWTAKRIEFGLYPDNTPVLDAKVLLDLPKDPSFLKRYRHAMLYVHTTYSEFVAAMMLASRMNMDDLYIPYLPGARQDKPRNPSEGGDYLPTLKFTMNLISQAGFRNVHVLDAHSEATREAAVDAGLGLVDHCDLVPEMLDPYLSLYDGIIAPDKGAVPRALEVAKQNDLPLLMAKKRRDPVTNALSGFSVKGLEKNRSYLVVDDICDAGGTFLGLGKKVVEAGAYADLYVTHGLFSKGATGRLMDVYGHIYTTDSLPRADRTTVLPAIQNMFEGTFTYAKDDVA